MDSHSRMDSLSSKMVCVLQEQQEGKHLFKKIPRGHPDNNNSNNNSNNNNRSSINRVKLQCRHYLLLLPQVLLSGNQAVA
jgi:hypothetical protein